MLNKLNTNYLMSSIHELIQLKALYMRFALPHENNI